SGGRFRIKKWIYSTYPRRSQLLINGGNVCSISCMYVVPTIAVAPRGITFAACEDLYAIGPCVLPVALPHTPYSSFANVRMERFCGLFHQRRTSLYIGSIAILFLYFLRIFRDFLNNTFF